MKLKMLAAVAVAAMAVGIVNADTYDVYKYKNSYSIYVSGEAKPVKQTVEAYVVMNSVLTKVQAPDIPVRVVYVKGSVAKKNYNIALDKGVKGVYMNPARLDDPNDNYYTGSDLCDDYRAWGGQWDVSVQSPVVGYATISEYINDAAAGKIVKSGESYVGKPSKNGNPTSFKGVSSLEFGPDTEPLPVYVSKSGSLKYDKKASAVVGADMAAKVAALCEMLEGMGYASTWN
jgi:hypothetical protein